WPIYFDFFFQAEDGIRDKLVTGVQTCALPIWQCAVSALETLGDIEPLLGLIGSPHKFTKLYLPTLRSLRELEGDDVFEKKTREEIGRASCRERGERWVGAV